MTLQYFTYMTSPKKVAIIIDAIYICNFFGEYETAILLRIFPPYVLYKFALYGHLDFLNDI